MSLDEEHALLHDIEGMKHELDLVLRKQIRERETLFGRIRVKSERYEQMRRERVSKEREGKL
jgi:hypothetical protein